MGEAAAWASALPWDELQQGGGQESRIQLQSHGGSDRGQDELGVPKKSADRTENIESGSPALGLKNKTGVRPASCPRGAHWSRQTYV